MSNESANWHNQGDLAEIERLNKEIEQLKETMEKTKQEGKKLLKE